MKKNFEKHTVPEKICIAFTVLLFTVYSITLIYPFVWGFLSSLKSGAIEYFDDPFGFPKEFHFENFRSAIELLEFNDIGFVDMVMNSLWFAAGSAVLSVLVTALCAYTFARYNFPFKNALYAFSIFIMMIPIYGSLPAQYKFFTQWGLRNSPRILVTALGAFGTSQFLIMTSYYRNLAKDYKDAALIDGASDFGVFFKVMFPQSRGLVITYMVSQFMGSWNDYYSPMLFLDQMPTLASGLFTYQTVVERTGNYPLYFAGIFISAIPVVILYSCMHNVMVKNLSFGGLKG